MERSVREIGQAALRRAFLKRARALGRSIADEASPAAADSISGLRVPVNTLAE